MGVFTQTQYNSKARPLNKQLRVELAVRPFLDYRYAPDNSTMLNNSSTLVCRCEEVSVGQLREHARQGCLGLNQTKTFSRCGMGPCQGRQCGVNAALVLADERKLSPDKIDYYRIRPVIKPVTLAEVASLAKEETN